MLSNLNILIIGRGKYALSIARIFRYSQPCVKINIILATTVSYDFGTFSKYVKKKYIISRPDAMDIKPFIQDIQNLIKKHNIKMIIPGAEEVFYVSKHRNKFQPSKIFAPNQFEFLNEIHNKYLFQLLLSEIKLKHLSSYLCSTIDGLVQQMAMFKDIGIETCVIKPVYSRGGLDAVICNNTINLLNNNNNNNDDINLKKIKISQKNPYVIQPFVNGVHLSTFSIAMNGTLVFHTCYRTLLPFKGFGTIREEVHDVELYNWCKQFINATNYTGHIGFDFIRGHIGAASSTYHRRRTVKEINDTGSVYAIECNPRTTNGLDILSLKYGKKIWKEYLKLLIEPTKEVKQDDDEYITSINDGNLRSIIRLRTTVPSIMAAFKSKTSKDVADSFKMIIFDTKDDVFWWNDPFPFFIMFFRAFMQFLSSTYLFVFQGIPMTKSAVESIKNELVIYPPG